MKQIILILISTIVLFACNNKDYEEKSNYSKYKPILISNEKINICNWETAPKENKNITQTLIYSNTLLLLDYGLGIHIIDISNPKSPQKLGFYFIPACIDMAIKDNFIYTNNFNDLLQIDISTPRNPTIKTRKPNEFNISISPPDELEPSTILKTLPKNTTIISYEKI